MALKFEKENLGGVIVLNTIGDFILFLTKLTIAMLCGVICYLFCRYASDNPSQFIVPTFITIVITFLISFYIVEILELVIDTIFMAFNYENSEMAKERGHDGKIYAPGGLQKLIKNNGDNSEEDKEDKDPSKKLVGMQV